MDGPTGACAGWERLLRLSREIALSGTCGVEPANGLFGVELEVFVIDANSGLAVDKLEQLLTRHRKPPTLCQPTAFLIKNQVIDVLITQR
jgi:hypothetical protein